jgi:hypothetical protein
MLMVLFACATRLPTICVEPACASPPMIIRPLLLSWPRAPRSTRLLRRVPSAKLLKTLLSNFAGAVRASARAMGLIFALLAALVVCARTSPVTVPWLFTVSPPLPM